MQQNFFHPAVFQALMERLNRLSSTDKPAWGIMTPVQLLKHLQLENDLALGNYRGKDRSNFFQEWAFKLVITGKMPLPTLFSKMGMVRAIPELDVVKSNIPFGSFDAEQEKLFRQLDELMKAEVLAGLHPAIGKMNREEWGYFYAWHTDYHLKQFRL